MRPAAATCGGPFRCLGVSPLQARPRIEASKCLPTYMLGIRVLVIRPTHPSVSGVETAKGPKSGALVLPRG
jgi:hypothetical protein